MVEVFALAPDLRPPQPFRPTPRMVDRAGPAHEMLEFVGVFGKKIGIQAIFIVSGPQLVQRMHQGLGNKRTAILAKIPIRTGQGIRFQGLTLLLGTTLPQPLLVIRQATSWDKVGPYE